MDLPKPSFLRTPVRSDWQPVVKSVKKDQPGRLISLKALRKEHLSPVHSSFLASISSSRLTDFPKWANSLSLRHTEAPALVSVRRLQAKRSPEPKWKGVGEVVGKQLLSLQSRVAIQIESKLPQRYGSKKSLSRSQRNSPRSKAE